MVAMRRDKLAEQLERIEKHIESQNIRPMSVEEAANYLHLAKSTVYKMTSRSEIPHFKSRGGKRLSFLKPDLDQWLLAHRVKSVDEIQQEVS